MINPEIKLPIVDKNKPMIYHIVSILFPISFVLFFTFLVFFNSKLFLIVLIVIMFISGTISVFVKNFNIDGYIIFNANQIVVNNRDYKEVFSLQDLQYIKLKYRGYKGEDYLLYPGSIAPKEGIRNYIEFYYQDKKYSFELLIEKQNLYFLNRIFDMWRSNNLNFILVGKWGFKTNSI